VVNPCSSSANLNGLRKAGEYFLYRITYEGSPVCRVRPLSVLCTQHLLAFLQEVVSKTFVTTT
jgi:hypothetical protein